MSSRTGTESNHTVIIGQDLILTHTVVDDAGNAVDLTGATLRALVKANRSTDADAAAVATFTCTVTSAAAGSVQLTLPDTETAKLDTETAKLTGRKNFDYDLKVHLPDDHALYPGYDDYPLWGTLAVQYPATRAAS